MAFVKGHPLITFFVLAYALTWPVIPLVSVSPLLGLPGLFGPALAAIVVASLAGGKSALKDLASRLLRWRVGARWYAVALGLPAVLALTAAGLHLLLGAPAPLRLGGLSALNFVVGEEVGWRGYALSRLLASRSALMASLASTNSALCSSPRAAFRKRLTSAGESGRISLRDGRGGFTASLALRRSRPSLTACFSALCRET
jgi:membrane protease YdiL (CAAX protease family)